MRYLLILLVLVGCSSPPRKPCQVERICSQHRIEVLMMMTNYPGATMDMLRTIATLEQEAGGYK